MVLMIVVSGKRAKDRDIYANSMKRGTHGVVLLRLYSSDVLGAALLSNCIKDSCKLGLGFVLVVFQCNLAE